LKRWGTAMNKEQIEEIRQECTCYIDNRRDNRVNPMSVSKFANLANISTSALSQWLNDRYKGDSEKIAQSVREYLDEAKDKVWTKESFDFVETSVAMQVRDALMFAVKLQRMVLVTSPPGDGKSEALRKYKTNQMILIEARSTTNCHALLYEIAEKQKVCRQNGVDLILRRLADDFKTKPRTLIIDESQHLNTRSLDALRHLWDQARIPILLSGNDEMLVKLQEEASLQQLASRLQHWRVQRISFEDAEKLIVQRFPNMALKMKKMIYEACSSTRSLCDMILALYLFCRMRSLKEPTQEIFKQVIKFKVAA